MELTLTRDHYPEGTNGILQADGVFICYTIELPWFDNWPMISCIPAGRYRLLKRYTARLERHLWLQDVPGRSWILIHPANDAKLQLQGCIAPVTRLIGPGKGEKSKDANGKLISMVYKAIEKERVWLTISGAAYAAIANNRSPLCLS